MGRSTLFLVATAGLSLGFASIASAEETRALRRSHNQKWRRDPKMIVFGESTSDAGRRFKAPASFDYDDIGPFPFKKLFEAPDSDSMIRAYLPSRGSASNGKVWPSWLRVPEEYNFATSSGSASDAFRSREICRGYSGEGEEFPTGTLSEQVTRYINDVLDQTDETLDYTHVIAVGGNEPTAVLSAVARYTAGGAGYVDPVAFENVFEVVDGVPTITFEPLIREVLGAWQEGISRLIECGVTGKILLFNMASLKAFPLLAGSALADVLDQVSVAVNTAAEVMFEAIPQVQMLDMYSLTAAIVDQPEIFRELGFTGGSETSLSNPCFVFNFAIDDDAEIMGTQAGRAAGCQEECTLCADASSPCQNCLEGNPSATVCEDPEKYLFWDNLHFTADVHKILGKAIRQCSKDNPKFDRPWVEVLCPEDA